MGDLPQSEHCDLGLIDNDCTEDLRKCRRTPVAAEALRSDYPLSKLEGQPMTILSAEPHCALPPGADENPDMVDNWQPSGDGLPEYRCIWSKPFDVGFESDADIRCVITQFANGSIPADGIDGPLVYVGMDDYTPADARRIAVAINAAADLAEKWVGIPEPAPVVLAPTELLANAFAALRAAHGQLETLPGNAYSYIQAALDCISDAAAVLR